MHHTIALHPIIVEVTYEPYISTQWCENLWVCGLRLVHVGFSTPLQDVQLRRGNLIQGSSNSRDARCRIILKKTHNLKDKPTQCCRRFIYFPILLLFLPMNMTSIHTTPPCLVGYGDKAD